MKREGVALREKRMSDNHSDVERTFFVETYLNFILLSCF
ncbi:hypothetical protein CUZ96_1382 [Enterococcus lactis]|nr:hypothetical protein [Enterococcus faecium]MBL5005773.1 hypothetical protein [Enterococcus lactis]MBK4757012.1 hypothetical protein [Enterococcus faecium]MBK4762981.1 hypothetical protein [Enterococcus faecium]MBK4776885.1 hypothetical protein [Enterococcus faecium]